jgi:hypothetical protein
MQNLLENHDYLVAIRGFTQHYAKVKTQKSETAQNIHIGDIKHIDASVCLYNRVRLKSCATSTHNHHNKKTINII